MSDTLCELPVNEIYLDHDSNCRGYVNAATCVELAKDIATRGLLQPITVRPLRTTKLGSLPPETDAINKGFKYKVIAGFRRLSAFKVNKAETIPCILKPAELGLFDERDINAVENLQREELTLWQECQAVKHYWMGAWSREDTAQRINKSPGWVQIRFALLNMPIEVQEAAEAGLVRSGDVMELNKYKGRELLEMVAKLKDRRLAGENRNALDYIRKKDKPSTRKHRGKKELNDMIEFIQSVSMRIPSTRQVTAGQLFTKQGNSIMTRLLAWAAGQISTIDFHLSMQELFKQFDCVYPMPDFSDTLENDLMRA